MFNISVNPTKIGNKFCLWHSRFPRLQRDYGLSALHSTILSTESSIDYFCLDCWSRAAGGLLWNQNPVIIILFTRRHIEPLDGLNKKTNEKKKLELIKTLGKVMMTCWPWDTDSHGRLLPDDGSLFAFPSRFVVAVVGSEQRQTFGEMCQREVLPSHKNPCRSQ